MSPRIRKPDVRTLFCVAAWKLFASSVSFACFICHQGMTKYQFTEMIRYLQKFIKENEHQPCPTRPHMCNPEEYELHTVIFPFARQYFERWWCNLHDNILNGDGAVPMFTFFLAFANLGAHVSSTIIPVLPSWESSYWINKWISTSTFFCLCLQ